MKIAIAGQAETTSIPHFGRAEFFTIFDIGEDQPRLLEVRQNWLPCDNGSGQLLELDQTALLLADCAAVLAGKIGPHARDALVVQEIIPLEHESSAPMNTQEFLLKLKPRLQAYAQQHPAWRQSK